MATRNRKKLNLKNFKNFIELRFMWVNNEKFVRGRFFFLFKIFIHGLCRPERSHHSPQLELSLILTL